ncbi:NlpC/P60 family protein [Williamsia sp. CHRR-6]|uniref:NlpC/P60 family protein n=1 Tax=Williamsia sp. CHRR-6 TaxID=2835871 RepID=UPI001BD9E689|nr:C40 family peptidase [Williamsia sp. CHRR-6]
MVARAVRVTAAVTLSLVTAGTLLGLGTGVVVGAPDPAPQSGLAALINQIADTDQRLADLDADVAIKRESVNRSLVDLQNARDQQRLATLAVKGSQDAVTRATAAISVAQRGFDDFVRSLYRQGSNPASMATYLSSADPSAVLDRAGIIDRLTRDQRATIQRLKTARNDKANRLATATVTKKQAASAAANAQKHKDAAIAAITAATTAARTEAARRSSLIAARDAAQKRLDALRAQAAAARNQASAPAAAAPQAPVAPAPQAPVAPAPVGAPAIPGRIPAAAPTDGIAQAITTAAQSAFQVAAAAAAKLATDAAQKLLADVVASLQGQHTDLDGAAAAAAPPAGGSGGPTAVTPGATGPAAVETVVNRALSQLGVTYAWGGGNGNGPTKGIRDGGVADSYGDYNKVGFDCSGLMMFAFAGIGISLPHYTGYQYTSGPQVPLSQMQRGDMIFYGPNASEHVALYLGNNQMVEAPQSGDVVKISPLRTSGAMPYVVRLTG